MVEAMALLDRRLPRELLDGHGHAGQELKSVLGEKSHESFHILPTVSRQVLPWAYRGDVSSLRGLLLLMRFLTVSLLLWGVLSNACHRSTC